MKKNVIKLLLIFSGLLLLFSGCSERVYNRAQVGAINVSYSGVIEAVDPVKVEGKGVGSFVGAVIGGILGHQIGSGSGKALATMGGTLAGSIVGDEADFVDGYKITIKLDKGGEITTILTKDEIGKNPLKVGDRVKILVSGNRVTDIERIGR